jgi:hypothetical protein
LERKGWKAIQGTTNKVKGSFDLAKYEGGIVLRLKIHQYKVGTKANTNWASDGGVEPSSNKKGGGVGEMAPNYDSPTK